MNNQVNYKKLGQLIRLCRRARILSQAELAKQADIPLSHVGHIERGGRKVSLETFVRLAMALDISPSSLLYDVMMLDHPEC